MRIVFAGTPELAVPSLHAVMDAGHDVCGVLTREDAPLGRKRVITPSPVARAAEHLGLTVHRANRPGEETDEWVGSLRAEVGVIVAYGALLREPLLSRPELGWINLHFSDLPRWRGAAPVQRALQQGERTLGITVFRLVEALDAGPVLARDSMRVEEGTPAGIALSRLAEHGTTALLRALRALHDDPAAGEPQIGEHSYADKLNREDGRIDVTRTVSEVLAHWAAVTPEPGAFVMHESAPLKVLGLERADASGDDQRPGQVRLADGRALLTVGDGVVELLRVQPAGKGAMAGADWLRGRNGRAVLS